MAKKKISGLPAGSALNGTELVPIVQTGTTKRITTQDIANLGNASGVEGSGTINTIAKFTASSTIGDSKFFDDGTNQGTETTTAVNRFIMSANASIAKIFSFRSGNLPRWAFRVDGTESGANAGADLAIRRYDDAGTFIDAPMTMDRSDGTISILKDATINGVKVGKGAGNLSDNTAIGASALASNTTGLYNTAIGISALTSNLGGDLNIAIGRLTLGLNTIGSNNTAVGANRVMNNNTSGSYNTALGNSALYENSSASANVAIGWASLYSNTASNNSAVGYEAGYSNTSGIITGIGYQSLRANTTGLNNTGCGNQTLLANTTGNANTAIGNVALSTNTTGSFNNAIGANQQIPNFDSVSMIGVADIATGSNQMRFGSAGFNNGAVTTEVVISDRTWSVFINGTAYKILLKA